MNTTETPVNKQAAIFLTRKNRIESISEALKKQRERALGKGADREEEEQPEPARTKRKKDSSGQEVAPCPPSNAQLESWNQRVIVWVQRTLEAAPTLPPGIRDEGFHLLREAGASTVTQHAAVGEPVSDTSKLSEWQKARAHGMSPQKIAAMDKVSLEDVCGALGIDVHQARNEVAQLRQSAEEAFAGVGIRSASVRDRMTRTATNGGKFSELTTPEQFRALLAFLSRANTPNGDPPAPDKEG